MNSVLKNYPWGVGLAAGGAGLMLFYLASGVQTMEMQHWIMLLVILIVGYALGRVWPAPGQMVGLP